MGVIPSSVKQHWPGAQGRLHRTEGDEFFVIYRCQVDNPNEQANTVVTYFNEIVTPLGSTYSYASDLTSSTALCRNIAAELLDASCDMWEVRVDYAPPDPDDDLAEDPDGDPDPDPINWAPVPVVGSIPYRVPVQLAKYISGYYDLTSPDRTAYPDQRFGYSPGNWIQMMNSAEMPFDPPGEREVSRHYFRLTGYFARGQDAKAIKAFEGSTNSVAFQWDHRGISWVADPFTAKIREITFVPGTRQGYKYVEVGFMIEEPEIQFLPGDTWGTNKNDVKTVRSWRVSRLDEGYFARAEEGDPTGRAEGETYDYAGGVRFPPDGKRARTIIDDKGEPIDQLIWLDGRGQPLPYGGTVYPPVYGQWGTYDEVDFHTIPLLKEMIEAVPVPE